MTIASPWRADLMALMAERKDGIRLIGSRPVAYQEPELAWLRRIAKLPALFRYKRRHRQPLARSAWRN